MFQTPPDIMAGCQSALLMPFFLDGISSLVEEILLTLVKIFTI